MQFIVRYTRTYERTVEGDNLEEVAARAKRVCDHTTDSRLVAVWDASKDRPGEIL